jgi:N-acetylglucosaminylphosphatidylinositol deacetylase
MVLPLISMMWDEEAPARPFALLKIPSGDGSAESSKQLINPRILLVTAHPDDEVLFAPTILSLLSDAKKKDATVYAVSLSTGDFEGGKELGEARTVEWARSWNTLGLPRDKRIILDEPFVYWLF